MNISGMMIVKPSLNGFRGKNWNIFLDDMIK